MERRVLLVDDSIFMHSLLKDALSPGGFQFVGTAKDGKTALELVEETKPALVILDNVLPDMLGADILEIIKSKYPETKVLMVSAVGQETMQRKCLQLGAEGYITKPFKAQELLQTAISITENDATLVA